MTTTKKTTRNQGKGFTLIELLVTMAIISLLTAVILIAGNKAQITKRNAQRIAAVTQYRAAFNLSYDDGNAYPDSGGSYACLGVTNTGCWQEYPDVPSVDAAITPYLRGTFELPTTGLSAYEGLMYYSDGDTLYTFLWFLEGVHAKCSPGSEASSGSYPGKTLCQLNVSAS